MSKQMEHIIIVIKALKEEILRRLDSGVEVSNDEINKITQEVFKKCAKEFGHKDDRTVRAQCTRDLEIDTATFYRLIKEYITGQNKNLEKLMLDHKTELDSTVDIQVALSKV